MIQKIYITSDVLRPAQNGTPSLWSLNSLYHLINYQLFLVTGLKPQKLIPHSTFQTSQELWLSQFNTNEPSWHLQQGLTKEDLIIGFELPPNTVEQLGQSKIPYINIVFSPIRFLDDLLVSLQHNFPSQTFPVATEETFYLQANFIKALLYKCEDINLEKNSTLIIGQSQIDRSLIYKKDILNLMMYDEKIQSLKSKCKNLYFKPHPHNQSPLLIDWFNQRGIITINNNIYQLLSCDEIDSVAGISSSVLYEAKYFNKNVISFHQLDQFDNFKSYISQHFISINFWQILLNEIMPTKKLSLDIPFEKDLLRKVFRSWWAFKDVRKYIDS